MEPATSLYPIVEMQKTYSGWVSGALDGIAGDSLQGILKRMEKLSYYASRFRGERDNAIKRLHQRYLQRSLSRLCMRMPGLSSGVPMNSMADTMLDNVALKDLLSKWCARRKAGSCRSSPGVPRDERAAGVPLRPIARACVATSSR
jgi:hypothetical protein